MSALQTLDLICGVTLNNKICEILQKFAQKFCKFLQISEFGAVRRNADLVELEKCEINAPTLAIVAVHTDENEPFRVQIRNN